MKRRMEHTSSLSGLKLNSPYAMLDSETAGILTVSKRNKASSNAGLIFKIYLVPSSVEVKAPRKHIKLAK